MSIIASVFTIALLVPSAINVGIGNDRKQRDYHYYNGDYGCEYLYVVDMTLTTYVSKGFGAQ